MSFRILFLGDVVGKVGRRLLGAQVSILRESENADLVVVNGENSAGGLGIDPACAGELFAAGVDVITTGNHIWGKKTICPYLDEHRQKIIRPHNYAAGAPGTGCTVWTSERGVRVAVINLMARVFMGDLLDCPFQAFDTLLNGEAKDADLVFVDFHGEATSEKVAFGHFADGRAQAVVGTHTHVQTADERVLPGGTAYITDVGMCGPYHSVIGVSIEPIVERFQTGRPTKFDTAKGDALLNGVLIEFDVAQRRATAIRRLNEVFPAAG
ncbi:MAG: TIGR00282 family metallophosphoesterase [Bdellovibrionales bacterium]|nr:TIGR00282 family metallophosphoesterase [Bdellovibrionales bacterium]